MAFTDIDACANALILLGHTAISSFIDETPAAQVCSVRYPMLREALLSDHPWNFTMSKVQLSQSGTAPISTYDHKYLLPSDGLADGVVAAYITSGNYDKPFTEYIIQEGFLLTNKDTVYVDYQRDVNEQYWPAYFSNLMAHAMAADIAFAITKKASIADYWDRKAYGGPDSGRVGGLMGRARALDRYHSTPNNKVSKFQLVNARRGGVDA